MKRVMSQVRVGWTTVWPKQGVYCHIRNITIIGEMYLYLQEIEKDHYINVISIWGDEMKKWVLNSQDKVLRLHHYLLARVGQDDLRVRINIKPKATLRPQ